MRTNSAASPDPSSATLRAYEPGEVHPAGGARRPDQVAVTLPACSSTRRPAPGAASTSAAARIELFEVGQGDPVLFLPGWGLSARAYTAALLPLAAAGLRVIAPSLPGFGASTPLPLRSPLADYASAYRRTARRAEPGPPVFAVGHSFGGGRGAEARATAP